MSATTDETKNPSITLPSNPFQALNFHFGMLLGVDDFQVMAGNPRGKMRLHQSWQHGTGVVWGLAVSIDDAAEEVRVAPGLAIDGLGREIPVTEDLCVNVPAWFAENGESPELNVVELPDGTRVFDVHVVAEAAACLDRPVPAVADGCQGDAMQSAYSRAIETARLRLVPGEAPPPPVPGAYPRVRLWLGLREAETVEPGLSRDQAVLDARAAAGGDADAARDAFAELLREDVMALRPAIQDGSRTSYPNLEPGGVVLANIRRMRLVPDGDGWAFAPPPALPADATELDLTVRQELAPTWLLQEALFAARAGVVGPRVVADSVALAGPDITFTTTADLLGPSVAPEAFSVTVFDAVAGWSTPTINSAVPDGSADSVRITLAAAPASGTRVRLIARGTGPTPLLGADAVPLGGPSDGDDGRDFVRHIDVP